MEISARNLVPVPDVIPIFPLAGTVLLPGEVLPLHIFETRYRDMVRDSLATHRVIGMVQPQRGHEEALAGSPPVRPVGCAGVIAKHFKLPDGRYLIWLLGLRSFRVTEEMASLTAYRQVRAERLPESPDAGDDEALSLRRILLAALPALSDEPSERGDDLAADLKTIGDDHLIVATVQALGLGAEERQALLELSSLSDRYRLLRAEAEERLHRPQAGRLLGTPYIH